MKIMDTNEQFSVIKVLNNNAVIVDDQGDEVILIQKGIGFNVKVNDIISPPEIDKMYRLSTVRDRQRYENLMQLSNEYDIISVGNFRHKCISVQFQDGFCLSEIRVDFEHD